MVGAGDDNTPAGRRIVAAIVLAWGKQPRQGSADGDAREQQDQRMREFHPQEIMV
jgi:hypothetical protein